MIHSKVKQFYDRQAKESSLDEAGVLDVSSAAGAIYRDRMEKSTLRRLLPGRRFSTVLELGCGNGRWLEFFAPLSDRVVGVDISAAILRHARIRLQRKRLSNVELIQDDACQFHQRMQYSLIYLSSLLLYLTDAEFASLLSGLQEMLEPGGILLCRDSLSTNERFERNNGYFAIYRNRQEFTGIFHEAGFRLLRDSLSYRHMKQEYWMRRFLPHWAFLHMPLAMLAGIDSLIDRMHRLTHRDLARNHGKATDHLFMLYEKR